MTNSTISLLITLCARGGSKGLPRKNILPINNTPLIGYSIKAAQAFARKHDADILLSTDSDSIRDVAAGYGLVTDYRRPEKLADDVTGKVTVIRDAVRYAESCRQSQYDFVLDLDVSSPLRTQNDLESAYEQFQANSKALTLFSVSPSHRNPYFNMVEDAQHGMVALCKRPDDAFLSRQSAPQVYDLNASFYFYRRLFFEQASDSVIQDNQSAAYVMPHICFDVDTHTDFTIMRFLIEQAQLGFDFP